ncbi:DNA polymerase subunit gamma-2, mitochondrial isoform X1 [Xylocopa sonorina]|uniref:DNA polymerase subunit gamma-2, mitochondrial isoform X1 n=1 Tax=Xylocopa sonorina TaxID=1818115 RepID=UPI00403B35DB
MNITHILKELSTHFISLTEHGLIYGPQGKMLLKNLEEHWFLHCVTMSRYNIFLSDECISTLNFVVKNTMDDIPFGLATIKNSRNSWNQSVTNIQKLNFQHKTAGITIFTSNTEAKDLFHKIQKERKIWWRRLAQCPSRFKLTDTKKVKNLDLVDVEVQFPFGSIVVEKITYHADVQNLFSKVDSKKDFSDIQMVEHMISLDWGCCALLCDAFDMNKSTKMHIHSKLAPYKVAFHIKSLNDEDNTQNDDLSRFILYLNNMLRAKGVDTILTTSKEIIDTCLVPFTVSVNTTSLENGIIHIKDRSTSLREAIHVTDLVKYITLRC